MWAKPPQLRVRSSQPTYFGIFWLPLNLLVSSLKWSKRWRISASPLCFKMLQVFTLCPMVPAKSCRAKTAPKDSSSPDGFCLRTITQTMMHCRSQQPTAERSERFQKKLIKAKWYRKGMKESIRVCSVCGWIRVHEYPTQSAVTESGPTPHESKQIAVHILEDVIPWRWLVWRAASSQLQTPEMRKACRVGLANVGIEYTGHLLLGYKLPSSWLRSNSFKRTMKGCRSLGQMISQANQVWYAQSNPMILIMNGEVNCKLAGKFNRSELLRLSILEHRWTGLFMTIHIFPGWWFLAAELWKWYVTASSHTIEPIQRDNNLPKREKISTTGAQTNKHGMSLHCRKDWTWIHENFRASICRKAANSVDLQASSQLLAPNLICFTATSSSTIQSF